MPSTFFGELGTKGDLTNTPASVVTLTGGASIGRLVVVAVNSGSGSDSAMTCVDSKGNTYQTGTSQSNGTSGRTTLFFSKLIAALAPSDTITVSGNTTRRAIIVAAFSAQRSLPSSESIGANELASSSVAVSNPDVEWPSINVVAVGYGSTATGITPSGGWLTSTTPRVITNNGFACSLCYAIGNGAHQAVEFSGSLSLPVGWAGVLQSIQDLVSLPSAAAATNFNSVRTRLKVF